MNRCYCGAPYNHRDACLPTPAKPARPDWIQERMDEYGAPVEPQGAIVSRRIVSAPGAAVEVTDLVLSASAKAALNTGLASFPAARQASAEGDDDIAVPYPPSRVVGRLVRFEVYDAAIAAAEARGYERGLAEAAKLREALGRISEGLPCDQPCDMRKSAACGSCGHAPPRHWCAGCIARSALASADAKGKP